MESEISGLNFDPNLKIRATTNILRQSLTKMFQLLKTIHLSSLLSTPLPLLPVRHLNANRCVVTKVKRTRFARLHPTLAVLPDGSTITIKYSEPKQLIKFPIKLEEASEEVKKRIQLLRRPKQKLVVTEDTGSGFDPRKYIKF